MTELIDSVVPAERQRDAMTMLELMSRLGPHTSGVGCVYVKDLTEVDLTVLEETVARSYATLTAGTYTLWDRDSGS